MAVAMNREIVFVGGAHASGKSTLCTAMTRPLRATHLTASELLDFQPTASDPTGKAVGNVAGAQQRLIVALDERTSAGGRFLLDGHFALISSEETVDLVPVNTFQAMDPSALILVEEAPEIIQARMAKRDQRSVPRRLIAELVQLESSHADDVADHLGCPLTRCTSSSDPTYIAEALEPQLEAL